MTDKFFQIFLESSAVDGLVSLTLVVRTLFFRFEECRVVLDLLWTLYPGLVLGDIEDFVDMEPQRS